MPIADFEKSEDYLLFSTSNGLVKRTALKDYRNVNASGIIALNLREGDTLVGVTFTTGSDHILLGTASGMAIRFDENDARVMGRNASGVKGIDLGSGDAVVGMVRLSADEQERNLLTVTEGGYGKRTPSGEYLVHSEDGSVRTQSRGGKGRRDMKTTRGKVVTIKLLAPGDDLMLITYNGMIVRIAADTIRQTGRNTQGVRVVNLKGDDRLVAVARVADDDDASDTAGDDQAPAPQAQE